MKIRCDNCGKVFNRKPSHIHKHNYCSRKCQYEHRRKLGILKAKKCQNPNCGAPIRKGKKYCSLSCYFRHMWQTKWAYRKTGGYEPSRRRFATIVLRVPQSCLTGFDLRDMIKQFNKTHGLSGKVVMNIIGERRLKRERVS